MDKRTIAVFDFDGTLTTKDTLLEFIKFSCGARRFYMGFLLHAPLLLLMKLHLYDNGKAKERVFRYFFHGWRYADFKNMGQCFADRVEQFKRTDMLSRLLQHQAQGDEIYVISASVPEWVAPWCSRYGVSHVLGTGIEVSADGIVTGRFTTPNCYGPEKVRRLLFAEPDRAAYCLYAYGDSRGDRELLTFADEGQLV